MKVKLHLQKNDLVVPDETTPAVARLCWPVANDALNFSLLPSTPGLVLNVHRPRRGSHTYEVDVQYPSGVFRTMACNLMKAGCQTRKDS